MLDILISIIMPICSAHIQIVNLQGRDGAAGIIDNEVVIAIDYMIPKDRLERVAVHESYHCIHLKNPEFVTRHFGKAPFVTEYARTDKYEDFAEEATELYFNGKPKTRKQRIIKRLMK